jgi:hypothetical protein
LIAQARRHIKCKKSTPTRSAGARIANSLTTDIASRTSLAQQGGLSWSIQFCHRLASPRSSPCAGLRAGMLGWSPCRQAPGRWAVHIDAAADVAWAAGLRQRLAKIRSRLGRLACPTEAEAEQKQRTNAKRIAPECGPPRLIRSGCSEYSQSMRNARWVRAISDFHCVLEGFNDLFDFASMTK